jgi:hypothetical protein
MNAQITSAVSRMAAAFAREKYNMGQPAWNRECLAARPPLPLRQPAGKFPSEIQP